MADEGKRTIYRLSDGVALLRDIKECEEAVGTGAYSYDDPKKVAVKTPQPFKPVGK